MPKLIWANCTMYTRALQWFDSTIISQRWVIYTWAVGILVYSPLSKVHRLILLLRQKRLFIIFVIEHFKIDAKVTSGMAHIAQYWRATIFSHTEVDSLRMFNGKTHTISIYSYMTWKKIIQQIDSLALLNYACIRILKQQQGHHCMQRDYMQDVTLSDTSNSQYWAATGAVPCFPDYWTMLFSHELTYPLLPFQFIL